MAENQDGQEKSQEPTSKRIQDARKKGQVPRSRELNTMALTLLGVATLLAMGPQFAATFKGIFTAQFALQRRDMFDTTAMLGHFSDAVREALLMLAPYFVIMIVIAVMSSIALGGMNFSSQAMQPKLSKFNVLKGMKKIFSARGLMELVKSLAKFVLIATATIVMLTYLADDLVGLSRLDVNLALRKGLSMVGWSALLISSTLIVLAVIDVPYQIWQYRKDLKMTQQEVRDEHKETEGRPEVKNQIRKAQFEAAQRRMMQEVPKADVVVTNPTHYAVALRYDPERMAAPLVVAKGKDLVANTIREVAGEHDVPLVEAPVLARAIYFNTELNHPIPTALFLAVAQLLAYVFQLRAYRIDGGDIPTPPRDYPVPEAYQHD